MNESFGYFQNNVFTLLFFRIVVEKQNSQVSTFGFEMVPGTSDNSK